MQHIKEQASYIVAVLIIAFSTYFFNYQNPQAVFWDENYHIASAQKYIDGVMYMEPHPPLGKLFIALGEVLINPNEGIDKSSFDKTDYIKHFPKGFSFTGYRFFPALFGALSALLFYFILYRIGRSREYAFLFSALYLFANAFILQSRSAMLESTQIFFVFAAILYFLLLYDRERIGYKEYFILGIFFGLALAVKLNGLILILLYPALYIYKNDMQTYWLTLLRDFVAKGIVVTAGMAVVFFSVFYIHFALGDTQIKRYKASPEYLRILKKHENASLSNFAVMMRDNLYFIKQYAKGVPRYNPCKKGENGSLATTWPFGNKSINYRRSKKEGKVSYLYLQINPVIWFSVVFAVILGVVLVVGRYVFGLHVKDRRLFYLSATFLTLYLSYMITMFNIERVMYLYHYFMPLFFGTFLLFSLFNYIFKEEIAKNSKMLNIAVVIFVLEIIYVYYYFSPFTYYKPLGTVEFMDRAWFDFWKLKPIL